jgi:hypothetical protein
VHDSDKDEKVVRPHVSLLSCLEDLAAPELIEDFYSTAIKGKTTATKYVNLQLSVCTVVGPSANRLLV